MRKREWASQRRDAGFTLIEVLVATTLLGLLAAGVMGLFATSLAAATRTRRSTTGAMLASARMEDLRGLRFGVDALTSGPVTDETTDLSTQPASTTGHGLRPSPADALSVNQPGYFDYLDRNARWVGTGDSPPPTAVYLRRWSVAELPSDSGSTLVLRVLVTTVTAEQGRTASTGPRGAQLDEVVVTSVRSRTGRGA